MRRWGEPPASPYRNRRQRPRCRASLLRRPLGLSRGAPHGRTGCGAGQRARALKRARDHGEDGGVRRPPDRAAVFHVARPPTLPAQGASSGRPRPHPHRADRRRSRCHVSAPRFGRRGVQCAAPDLRRRARQADLLPRPGRQLRRTRRDDRRRLQECRGIQPGERGGGNRRICRGDRNRLFRPPRPTPQGRGPGAYFPGPVPRPARRGSAPGGAAARCRLRHRLRVQRVSSIRRQLHRDRHRREIPRGGARVVRRRAPRPVCAPRHHAIGGRE